MSKQLLDTYLILGCNGHVDSEGFVNCPSVANPIIDLAKISDEQYAKLVKFLDQACGLFDHPIYDHNKCTNSISLLYKNFNIIDQHLLYKIQWFIKTHRQCGLYLILAMKEDFDNERRN